MEEELEVLSVVSELMVAGRCLLETMRACVLRESYAEV